MIGCRERDGARNRNRNRDRNGDRDRGSATVWLLAFVLVVWVAAAVALAYGAAVAARHRAATAADLAALAGALAAIDAAQTGQPRSSEACIAAGSVAAGNGARLVDCRLDGFTVAVVAAIPLPGLAQLFRFGSAAAARVPTARATARAGPT